MKVNIFFKKVFYQIGLIGLGILFINTYGFSQIESDNKDSKVSFHGRLEISTDYNDNILNYSPRDLSKMDTVKYAGNNLKKFSVDRSSDNITAFKIRFGTTLPLIVNSPTSIRLRTNQYFHNANHIVNYSSWQFEIKQVFMKKNFLTFNYKLLPRYYLRNLWYHQKPERNPYRLYNRYVEAFLSKKSYSLDIERNFSKKISAAIGYEYDYSEYNQEFSERNNSTHNIKLDANIQPIKPIELSASYVYAISWASGRENFDSTISDISYKSHRFNLGIDISLSSLIDIPLLLSNNFVYESQKYLSDKIPVDTVDGSGNTLTYGDKYHYGRVDNYYKISLELSYRLSKMADLFITYAWEQNKTNLTETSDAGSYQVHQIGGGARFTF